MGNNNNVKIITRLSIAELVTKHLDDVSKVAGVEGSDRETRLGLIIGMLVLGHVKRDRLRDPGAITEQWLDLMDSGEIWPASYDEKEAAAEKALYTRTYWHDDEYKYLADILWEMASDSEDPATAMRRMYDEGHEDEDDADDANSGFDERELERAIMMRKLSVIDGGVSEPERGPYAGR